MPYKRLKILKGYIDRALAPPLRHLGSLGVKPIHLTLMSLPCGLLGVWFLYSRPLWSFPLVGLYIILDVLDGTLARVTGTVSELGAKVDFLFDRLVACAFLLNYYFHSGDYLFSGLALALIIAVSLEDAGLIRR
jgi:phosphatidylglycerophosphate synthase